MACVAPHRPRVPLADSAGPAQNNKVVLPSHSGWESTLTAHSFLGEFEHLVVAAALRLDRAYGAQLMREIEGRTGRSVQAGAIYVTLDRLEAKGYVTSELAEPDARRGGRPRRFITVTPEGVRALAEHREALLRIWSGLEERLEGA